MSIPSNRFVFPDGDPSLKKPPPRLVLADVSEVFDREGEDELEWEAEMRAHRLRALAVVASFALHGVLVLLAALVLIRVTGDDPPQIEVAPEVVERPAVEDKREFEHEIRRPSRASAKAVPVLASAATSSFAVPAPDDVELETLDFGTGDAGDLGFGPSGLGGANFLGLSAGRDAKHVILLIDVSGSMFPNCGPEGLEAIKREVVRTVNSLRPDVEFNIFTFAGAVDGFRSRSVPAAATAKRDAIAFFEAYFGSGGEGGLLETRTEAFGNRGRDDDGVPYHPVTSSDFSSLRGISGGTRLELAVFAAMQSRPQAIFVISDGEPASRVAGQSIPHTELLDMIQEEHDRLYRLNQGVRISTISVKGQGAGFMRALARRFGGVYKSISPAEL